jgi:hypothetical protein
MDTSFPCTSRIFSGINFSDLSYQAKLEDLCNAANDLEIICDNILRRLVIFFLILLAIVSIFGQIRENYKWIVLHTAFWALFIIIILEISYYMPPNVTIRSFIYINHISVASFLLLAINRFL